MYEKSLLFYNDILQSDLLNNEAILGMIYAYHKLKDKEHKKKFMKEFFNNNQDVLNEELNFSSFLENEEIFFSEEIENELKTILKLK